MKKRRIVVFAVKEFAGVIITIFLVMTVLFFLFHSLPGGDPVTRMYPFAASEFKEQLREAWGLNKPLFSQYLIFMERIFTLDFSLLRDGQGDSLRALMYFLPYTLMLFGTATIISYTIGTFLGIRLLYQRNIGKKFITAAAIILYTFPAFLLAVYFRTWFVFKYQIFPPVSLHLRDYTELLQFSTVETLLPTMVLPLIVLVMVGLARPLLLMRDHMSLVAEEPFVMTARAKGLPESTIRSRHVARNAMLPLLNDASINVALMVSGGILIEYVFGWPGIGLVLFRALYFLDTLTISAAIFLLTVMLLISMIIVDILNAYLDPRVRL